MKKILIIAFSLSLFSCSTLKEMIKGKDYHKDIPMDHQELLYERLIPRRGYDGFLTNQICKEFDSNGKCIGEISLRKYSIEDQAVRSQLNKFKFACSIGGKRYRICETKAGFCRQESGCLEYKTKIFSREKYCSKTGVVYSDFIPVREKYQYLIDGATECQSGF